MFVAIGKQKFTNHKTIEILDQQSSFFTKFCRNPGILKKACHVFVTIFSGTPTPQPKCHVESRASNALYGAGNLNFVREWRRHTWRYCGRDVFKAFSVATHGTPNMNMSTCYLLPQQKLAAQCFRNCSTRRSSRWYANWTAFYFSSQKTYSHSYNFYLSGSVNKLLHFCVLPFDF